MGSSILHFDEAMHKQHLHALSDEDLRLADEKNKKTAFRSIVYGTLSFWCCLLPITAVAARVWIVEQKKQKLIFREMTSRGMPSLQGPMWENLPEEVRDNYRSGRVGIEDWEDVEDLRKRAFPVEEIHAAIQRREDRKKESMTAKTPRNRKQYSRL